MCSNRNDDDIMLSGDHAGCKPGMGRHSLVLRPSLSFLRLHRESGDEARALTNLQHLCMTSDSLAHFKQEFVSSGKLLSLCHVALQ